MIIRFHFVNILVSYVFFLLVSGQVHTAIVIILD